MSNARRQLEQLLDEGGYVLFTGAGASVEAGLKPWGPSLNDLAAYVEGKDPSYAAAMRAEIARWKYLQAAELFYMAEMTSEDRASFLTAVFGREPVVTSRLCGLIRQPFRAVVTTNYDRALILAAAKEKIDLVQFSEAADDIAAARVCRSRFVLRLHGRIEVPNSNRSRRPTLSTAQSRKRVPVFHPESHERCAGGVFRLLVHRPLSKIVAGSHSGRDTRRE